MRMNSDRDFRQGGFTLIELIVALVVLGVGVSGFLILINQATLNSVDPLLRTQANAVAQSYLEEILLQPFCDPDDTSDCPATCTGSPCAACSTSEGGNRPVYDDVFDYLNLPDNVVRDRNNNAIAGLGDYSVTVGMQDSGVNFSGLSGGSCQVVRVDVDVTHTNLPFTVTLSGYKVNY
ncbi:MAG: prepilin-type N-terminal cleavage/methylation domain-containing protein [Gammaproteobacteria bacterium]|nr:prepilin-type N-terminal cleavage/methylation domain-containing protein [Gammaproteobacteria bacterium]